MDEEEDEYKKYLKAISGLSGDATGNQMAVQNYDLLQSVLSPEKQKMLRQQESINALRESSMQAPQTRMYGGVAVAPSWAQVLGNVAQGLSAGYQQKKLDKSAQDMAGKNAEVLKAIMQRQGGGVASTGNDHSERQRNLQQYGVPLTDEEIRRRQQGLSNI